MSYVFVNEDLKFLALSSCQTHGGRQLSINWVEKDSASVFKTDKLSFEVKMYSGTASDVRKLDSLIVGSFKVELIRTVKILKEQP